MTARNILIPSVRGPTYIYVRIWRLQTSDSDDPRAEKVKFRHLSIPLTENTNTNEISKCNSFLLLSIHMIVCTFIYKRLEIFDILIRFLRFPESPFQYLFYLRFWCEKNMTGICQAISHNYIVHKIMKTLPCTLYIPSASTLSPSLIIIIYSYDVYFPLYFL